ncbi:MAG: sulfotransferase [Firmicutes bacterium]|nr:sulfotransferase [Bacillota bacterium]
MDVLSYFKEILYLNKEYFRHKVRVLKEKNSSPNYSVLLDDLRGNYGPIFVLSTGRCGTRFLTNILQLGKDVDVYHMPQPELIYHSKKAYEEGTKRFDTFKEIVYASRIELIQQSYFLNRKYIETNNRITFFAPHLFSLFPKARFIHLIRDPINFIKSGMSRGWYSGWHRHDSGRIIPKHCDGFWPSMSQECKLAWLWKETNLFITNYLDQMPQSQFLIIRAEDAFSSTEKLLKIIKFCRIHDMSVRRVEKVAKRPANKGKVAVPDYSQWDKHIQLEIHDVVSDLAKRFNYRIK